MALIKPYASWDGRFLLLLLRYMSEADTLHFNLPLLSTGHDMGVKEATLDINKITVNHRGADTGRKTDFQTIQWINQIKIMSINCSNYTLTAVSCLVPMPPAFESPLRTVLIFITHFSYAVHFWWQLLTVTDGPWSFTAQKNQERNYF